MTRIRGIMIAAAGVAVCAVAMTFCSNGETRFATSPPCSGMKDGKPDPIVRIEISEYRRNSRQPAFEECAPVDDVTRLAQVDAFLKDPSAAWQRLDADLAAIPRARFTFIRGSGKKEELTLIDGAFINADWLLRFDSDAYLMFNNMIEPVCPIPTPPQSGPSPLTWLFQVVCR